MRLTSLAFGEKLPVPSQYTCTGRNISPPLEFIDVPNSAKSLAILARDDDSPDKKIYWLVFNIPGNATHLDEGTLPQGAIAGLNSDGKPGYEGPCPKNFHGIHRFRFTLFALDQTLDMPAHAPADEVIGALMSHVIDYADLMGIAEGE